ncbi:MAG: TraR/DksA C4-type zinc finger protein [Candidatus Woesearchaeota archaeon]
MDNNTQRYFRKKLIKEKKSLLKSLINFNSEERKGIKDSTGELSSYDNHPGDQGTNTYDREKDNGLRDNTLSILKKVNMALNLIKKNKYGICQNCNKNINLERLEAIPYSLLCKGCNEKEEKELIFDPNNLKVEEDIEAEQTQKYYLKQLKKLDFDKEKAWLEVAKFGTSHFDPEDRNNPQDPDPGDPESS